MSDPVKRIPGLVGGAPYSFMASMSASYPEARQKLQTIEWS